MKEDERGRNGRGHYFETKAEKGKTRDRIKRRLNTYLQRDQSV